MSSKTKTSIPGHLPAKLFNSLRVYDLELHPIWQFIYDDGDEVSVFPIEKLPVSNLRGRLVGTRVSLANGIFVWAMILYLDVRNVRKNQHYTTLLIENRGQWFTLSRYWDEDYLRNGPVALARFLELPVDEVFPISYDVREHVEGDREALVGRVHKEPIERLSEEEIIKLAVP